MLERVGTRDVAIAYNDLVSMQTDMIVLRNECWMFEIHDGPQFSSIVSDQGSKTLNSSRLICRGNAATIYDEETVRLLLSSVNVRCGPQAMHYADAEAVMID